ncbi:hypothetical protein [Thalassomonas actiniarum]|uniref:Uncharacterized protein n=1 Tax=Thalassomonas actiniarum TaxID=485447 RepID=A0AAE9YS51_9GAMM|nr:hypothetical protein [Thalassomonas actiniarum]WDD98492.1 hypothetical protein SG35_025100 [Thalassomonas actiniarum]
MANPNDMPEFHSVKVSLTENIPTPRHPSVNHVTETSAAKTTAAKKSAVHAIPFGNCGFSSFCLCLTIKGGRCHV